MHLITSLPTNDPTVVRQSADDKTKFSNIFVPRCGGIATNPASSVRIILGRPTNKVQHLAIIPDHIFVSVRFEGDGMDQDLIALMKLKVSKRRRHRPQLRTTPPRGNEVTFSRTKMLIGQWFVDELGNRSRVIKTGEP
jgi:hypothetical protein